MSAAAAAAAAAAGVYDNDDNHAADDVGDGHLAVWLLEARRLRCSSTSSKHWTTTRPRQQTSKPSGVGEFRV